MTSPAAPPACPARARARGAHRWLAALPFVLVCTASPPARAKEDPPLLVYPASPAPWAWRLGAGALVDMLPARAVESEQRQIPLVTAALRVGLPAGFSAGLRLRALIIQNQLEAGVAWGLRTRHLAFGIHNHFGPWFGVVGVEGFDTTAWGLVETPGVTVGVPWQDVRFSLTEEVIFELAQHTRLGDATQASRDAVVFAGTATSLTVETILAGGGVPYFGLGLLWTQPDHQLWLAFSDERARVIYPRFFAGYAF